MTKFVLREGTKLETESVHEDLLPGVVSYILSRCLHRVNHENVPAFSDFVYTSDCLLATTVVSVTSDSPTEFEFPTSLCMKTIGIDGPDFANVVEKIEVWPAYFGCTAPAMLSCAKPLARCPPRAEKALRAFGNLV